MDIAIREHIDQLDEFDKIFNDTSYRRYVLKYHIDVPDSQRQSTKILKPKSKLHEYKNFTYYYQDIARKRQYKPTKYQRGICVGYHTKTIADYSGISERYMPVYNNKLGIVKIKLNMQFNEQYKEYARKIEIKKMWDFLISLFAMRISTKIAFCNNIIEQDVSIPVEIGHNIYAFWKEE